MSGVLATATMTGWPWKLMGLIARPATLDEGRQQAARKQGGWHRRDQFLTHHLVEGAGSLLDHRAGKVIYPYNALGAVIVKDRLYHQESGVILYPRIDLKKLPLAVCILNTAVRRVVT